MPDTKKTKILISDPLSQKGTAILKAEKSFAVDEKFDLSPSELGKIIKNYDSIIIRSQTRLTDSIISKATNLKVIGRAGVGLDNVDIQAASKRGIIVMNAPEGNTIATAEHTISMMLSLTRNIPQACVSMREKKWDRKKYVGAEVYQKVLGIIGLGRIGAEVAKRAKSFGMRIVAYDPYLADKAQKLGIEQMSLDEIFGIADYITVHSPLTDDTRHIIGKQAFKKMKKGVRIINCARGGIVDEKALYEAIQSGKVAGAALDVYEEEPPTKNPLIDLPQVIATPHLGASTKEAQLNVAVDVAQAVKDALAHKGIRNAVNMPAIDFEKLKAVAPYIDLAERTGSFHMQVLEGTIKEVKIRYIGDFEGADTSLMTTAYIKGLLTPILQETVNYVNARFIAKERKINIVESVTTDVEDFAHLICAEVKTDKGTKTVLSTLFTKMNPRIVKVDEYYVDAIPQGTMIKIRNKDVPGFVGQVGTVLGKNKINIAEMSLGKMKNAKKAMTILNIDGDVSKDVLKKIRQLKSVEDVKLIKIDIAPQLSF